MIDCCCVFVVVFTNVIGACCLQKVSPENEKDPKKQHSKRMAIQNGTRKDGCASGKWRDVVPAQCHSDGFSESTVSS